MASRSIICIVEALIIDLRDTDKSRYFAQPRSIIVLSFDHRVCFLMDIFGKRCGLPFSPKSDHKKEKSLVSFTHEQNIICSQTNLDDIAHEQTIIFRSRGGLTANGKEEKTNVFHNVD